MTFDVGTPKPCEMDADCWDSQYGDWCNPGTMSCGNCSSTDDCVSDDEVCQHGACVVPCTIDDDCPAAEPHCNTRLGECAQCVVPEDCAVDEFCHSSGVCAPDECTPGDARCFGHGIGECAADGSGFEEQSACAGGLLCEETAAGPTCAPAPASDSSSEDGGTDNTGTIDPGMSTTIDSTADDGAGPSSESSSAPDEDMVTPRGCACDAGGTADIAWLWLPLLVALRRSRR